jgi:Peptidase_C39 like family
MALAPQAANMTALLLLLLSAAPASVQLTGFPFVQQKPDFCGEAAAEMALRRLGRSVTQDDVFNASGVDPLLGRGVYTNELAQGLRQLGVEPGPVWHHLEPSKAVAQRDAQFDALLTDLRAGQPSIVCMHYDASLDTTEHFRLVTGYDAARDEVVYQEPAVTDGADRRMRRSDFLALWTFKPAKDRWTLIRLRMTPATSPPVRAFPSPTPAELSQHVQAMKLPKEMTLAWEPPFLVIGDEAPAKVRSRAKDVVRWCRDLLLADFFTQAPQALHEVWVLKDAASYTRVSKGLFGTTPTTPYGYFLSGRRALVMNIKPGYGTLTHELVHPFMHQAWPGVPAWLNEGVASLFEFPYEEGGHLKGRVNWRLPALQRALADGAAPSFHTLTHLSDGDFYADGDGVHYAAARYLCFWLQERGLLSTFVKRAIALQDKDSTAHGALAEVLGAEPDSRRAEWETFVKGLSRN